jgi:hypothetical protein
MEAISRGGRPVQGFALGSDGEDVEAIQRMLTPMQPQIAAFVATCKALDPATKNLWYPLAKRVVDFVSGPSDGSKLALAQALRDDVNNFMQTLKNKGCGDVPTVVMNAPPETIAPPPHDPENSFFEGLFGKGKDPFQWFADHKVAIIATGAVVGGVVVLGALSPYARLLAAAIPHRRAG